MYKQLSNAGAIDLSFDDVGFNVYSQTNEDGILLYIYSLLGLTNRKCVDIGAGAIEGSNVANLLVNHGFGGDGRAGARSVAGPHVQLALRRYDRGPRDVADSGHGCASQVRALIYSFC